MSVSTAASSWVSKSGAAHTLLDWSRAKLAHAAGPHPNAVAPIGSRYLSFRLAATSRTPAQALQVSAS